MYLHTRYICLSGGLRPSTRLAIRLALILSLLVLEFVLRLCSLCLLIFPSGSHAGVHGSRNNTGGFAGGYVSSAF